MPELTSALREAAGAPLLPLDLDGVHARGARRRRNVALVRTTGAAALIGVVALAALALAGSGEDRATILPGGPDTSTVAPSPEPSAVDGTFTVQVQGAYPDRTVVLDEVTEKGCSAVELSESTSYETVFRTCWDDPDDLPLTLPVSPTLSTVEVHPEGDPFTDMPWSQFVAYTAGRVGNPDFLYTVWQATVVDGRVTELTQTS